MHTYALQCPALVCCVTSRGYSKRNCFSILSPTVDIFFQLLILFVTRTPIHMSVLLLLLNRRALHQLLLGRGTLLLAFWNALGPTLLLLTLGLGTFVQTFGQAGLVCRILLGSLESWVNLGSEGR